MDARLLESLLHQEESEALDFKLDQYPFDGATEEQKGELLKDILAFTNAWRQTDAHILIGVEEVRGRRSIPRGIQQHLLNRNLQQFVLSKTNRPVTFNYAPVSFQGVELGVLTIPRQDRPAYLVKAYGKLAPQTVYIRRSETTAIASPDEVARMGAAPFVERTEPTLLFDFADLSARQRIGSGVCVHCEILVLPTSKDIPLYGEDPYSTYGIALGPIASFQNRKYYREFADYIRDRALLAPIGFAVTNTSPTVAEDVNVNLSVGVQEGLQLIDSNDVPLMPSKVLGPRFANAHLRHGRRVHVGLFGQTFEVRAELGNVQPGTTAWSPGPFYMGAATSLVTAADVIISANNLSMPVALKAEITCDVNSRSINVRDVLSLCRSHE